MPARPSKPQCPRDSNQLAKAVIDIATGAAGDQDPYGGKNPAAVELGRLGGHKGGKAAAVWLVMVDRSHVTQVLRGENRGTEMNNYNVVRKLKRIGTWNGKAMTIPVPMPEGGNTGDLCAVFVQAGATGPILGAARLDLTMH